MLFQAIHGTQYIDEVAALRLPTGLVYVHQDANFNVVALTDVAGQVLERVRQTPYGEVEFAAERNFFDYDGDSDTDSADLSACGDGAACWGAATGPCRVFDVDLDGDVDASDQATVTAYVSALPDEEAERSAVRTSSRIGNVFAHQGLVYDAELASYQNRARQYNPGLKRFLQRDPLALNPTAKGGYQDGANLLTAYRDNPNIGVDPSGYYYWLRGLPCDACRAFHSCRNHCRNNSGSFGLTWCNEYFPFIQRCVCICDENIKARYTDPVLQGAIQNCVEIHEMVHYDNSCRGPGYDECTTTEVEGHCAYWISVDYGGQNSTRDMEIIDYLEDGLRYCTIDDPQHGCPKNSSGSLTQAQCKSQWCLALYPYTVNGENSQRTKAGRIYGQYCQ
jgi:RHS repeat-associated protein